MPEPDTLREFEFLPNLPKSNLDDRAFEDLVQECILRIPRYCPEWTNHNPGDPGITLIELFSWLVKQMLFRFNQVPRRNYVAFLELLGIRLLPPTPAHVDLTFHLIKSQNLPRQIPINTEVATVRTETEPAIVFTTDAPLTIGQPQLRRLFTAQFPEAEPTAVNLHSPFQSPARDWTNLNEVHLFENCAIDNCFYLVLTPANLSPDDSIQGNIIALTFKGVTAGTTGITPDDPPLRWEAWDGEQWRSHQILRQPQDDRTKGFSFHELRKEGFNLDQGADVILHLPQQWQETDFGQGDHYRGYWLRCVYVASRNSQNRYSYTPIITSLEARSIGGTIHASECVRIEAELLGTSDGKPGQAFQLRGLPVLDRKSDEEYIEIKLPNGELENWEEVSDFGNSTDRDRHYVIDSQTGVVQFGPLIREPAQLQRQIRQRNDLQPWGKQPIRRLPRGVESLTVPLLSADAAEFAQNEEWQYGRVPPIGSEIYLTAYRVGGGSRGNVQAEKLTVLKTAIPYVKQVVNYAAAQGGREGDSLDEAVIRVPQILRTSRAAVTSEDFENIAKRSYRSIYRAHCPPDPEAPGIVRLLIVPAPDGKADPQEIDFRQDFPQGMQPDRYFGLEAIGTATLKKLRDDFDERKPMGIQVKLDIPAYMGVKVVTEVLLEPHAGSTPSQIEMRQTEIRAKLQAVLYRFLNPITGGFEGTGWVMGRPVRPSDIVALLQDMPEVRYVGTTQLYGIRKQSPAEWILSRFPEMEIKPGQWGLLCSWQQTEQSAVPDFGHAIAFMEDR